MKAVTIGVSLAAALAAGSALAQDREPDAGVKVGTLTCKATDITNVILFTDTDLDCVYDSVEAGFTETYEADIDQIGVNLSIKNDVTLVWAVLAPTETEFLRGQLEGTYVGAGADASLGIGAGANLLVGGGENGFTLQPLSVEGIEGAGVSLGIKSFELEATG
ncbi:MAG TPA: DUF992 domain-containing protein [Paracoccaceae bacterium]|nr:DUF992 domain-containing protein [Paracoccaceae bacterium]